MITLGNNKFDVPLPRGMRSFSLQQRILPVAGRVANVFLALVGADLKEFDKLFEADVLRVLPQALPAIGEIFALMPPNELEMITRELLSGATCDGVPLFGASAGDPFDALMQGRTIDTWQLLWHAIKIWYPDFFTRAGMLLASSGAKVKPSEASSTSQTSGPVGV